MNLYELSEKNKITRIFVVRNKIIPEGSVAHIIQRAPEKELLFLEEKTLFTSSITLSLRIEQLLNLYKEKLDARIELSKIDREFKSGRIESVKIRRIFN
ncbi:MAG: hypothetical protein DRP68_04180 [Candidatus Omnitrophota bacterium]|nr:MAG: hypothetical protein DRP68_04180 [Candidatus Omnitrophota bacterium]RKY36741.1 MAG: hypothetical protein DRP72_03790 [Candidatus Omnitrophota bacterium]